MAFGLDGPELARPASKRPQTWVLSLSLEFLLLCNMGVKPQGPRSHVHIMSIGLCDDVD